MRWNGNGFLIRHFIITTDQCFLRHMVYGAVLLAGAEIIRLIDNNIFEINENSLQLKS